MLGQVRVSAHQLVGDAADGGVEGETGLHRGDQKVEQVREAVAVFPLARLDARLDHLLGAEQRQDRKGRRHQYAQHALAVGQRQHQHCRHRRGGQGQDAGAQVIGHSLAVEEARLHQLCAQGRGAGRILDGHAVAHLADLVDHARQHFRAATRFRAAAIGDQAAAALRPEARFAQHEKSAGADADRDQDHGQHGQDVLDLESHGLALLRSSCRSSCASPGCR